MIRLQLVFATLLLMVVPVSVNSVSARTRGTSGPVLTGTDTGLNGPAFLLSNFWLDGNNNNQGGDNNNQGGDNNNQGGDNNNQGGNNNDQGNDNGPNPAPEPSTMLSFGAALLIGGGVLYSLRLRRNRK